jgi:hypothetical protein
VNLAPPAGPIWQYQVDLLNRLWRGTMLGWWKSPSSIRQSIRNKGLALAPTR